MDIPQGIDKSYLLSATSNAALVLRGTPFTVFTFSPSVRYDPRRCLLGSPLGPSEIEAGFAVGRRLYIESQECEVHIEEISSWLAEKTGKTLVLLAQAGEGKTTLKHLLCRCLMERSIMLEWNLHSPIPFDHQKLRDFHFLVRDFLPREVKDYLAPKEPILIVFGDVKSAFRGPTADEICNSLAERIDDPDHSILLILGRPGELNPILPRITAETIRLLPLNQEEARTLCANLEKAYMEMVATGISDAEIKNCYPNLLKFLNLPRPGQIALFLEPQKPLLAALLQAVYGEDFWRRLKGEFDSLELEDKTAYLDICLASSAGERISEELLLRLTPNAQLDKHCQYNPWVRLEDGTHVARHRVIAQTVIEESQAYALLRQCLIRWLIAVERREISPLLVWRIFNQMAEWQPIAPERGSSVRFKGIIRRLARQAIGDYKTFVDYLESTSEIDERHLIQWASTIHALLPEEPQTTHLFLFEANRRLLEKVLATTVNPHLQERVRYYVDKNERDQRKVKGQTEKTDEVLLRVKKWAHLMEKRRWGPDFFADLFLDAADLARTLTFGSKPADANSEQLYEPYLIAAVAFEKLRLETGYDEKCRKLDIGKYSELIGRFVHHALPTQKRKVLQAAWKVSDNTENPNPKTGIQYAKLLPREKARLVLKKIIEKHPAWGEAHFELASLVETDMQRNEALYCIQTGFKAEPSGLSLALLNHAAALIEQDSNEREKFFRLAVQGYHAYIKSVESIEERKARIRLWQEACQDLRKLTKDIPPECVNGVKEEL